MKELSKILMIAAVIYCGPAFAGTSFSLVPEKGEHGPGFLSANHAWRAVSPIPLSSFPEHIEHGFFIQEPDAAGTGLAAVLRESLDPRVGGEKEIFDHGIYLFRFRRDDYANILKLSDMPIRDQYKILKKRIEEKTRAVSSNGNEAE